MAALRVAGSRSRAEQVFPVHATRDITIIELVSVAHQRWRIERDYQDLKQDFGLRHYEGRGWLVPPPCRLEHRGLRIPDGRTPHRRQASRREKYLCLNLAGLVCMAFVIDVFARRIVG